MPELPDVQVLKEYVDATSLHREVDEVMVRAQLVEGVSPQTIRDNMPGAELVEARRHGKHLFLLADGRGWLRLHFGMTGTLTAYSRGSEPDHTELRLDFIDGRHLAYVNQRKFGAISWLHDIDKFIRDEELGPDPLDGGFDVDALADRLDGHRGALKARLMDQSVLAGLGNIYVDEILFQAGLHPQTKTGHLDGERIERLHAVMRRVIDEAVSYRADVGEMPETWLLPNRDEGADCPRDGGTIARMEVSGRSTYVCTEHQVKVD